MIKTILIKTGEATRKSLLFIVFKHKYAFWFAIGMVVFAAALIFCGTPLMIAHQSEIAGLSATINSHSELVIFSHIFLLIAIYFILMLWVDHLSGLHKSSEERRLQATNFIRIFIAALVLILVLGHI